MARSKAKADEVVLVSPKGNEHVITDPATLHNLLAKGYRIKGKTSVHAAEQKVAAPAPVPERPADPKPAEK